MALDTVAIFSELTSHAKATGLFKQVSSHEPKVAPGKGLTAAFWVSKITPTTSGLASTSAQIVFVCRIFSDMLQEPQSSIDPTILSATDKLLNSYNGDFQLGGTISWIDILGAAGVKLEGTSNYIFQDNRWYRVMDITIPVIVEDVWSQVP
jgi:hypothetical protein